MIKKKTMQNSIGCGIRSHEPDITRDIIEIFEAILIWFDVRFIENWISLNISLKIKSINI